MSTIKFTPQELEAMTQKLQTYFADELDQELGQFDAGFLLDFFAKELGAFYYNQGLQDARTILAAKLDSIDDEIYAIEKETKL